MTFISNDPAWWPSINWAHIFSYFIVASSTAVVYDWALSFGQEFGLIWVRYVGIMYSVESPVSLYYRCSGYSAPILAIPFQMTALLHRGGILWFIQAWTPVIINAMLGVIMTTRIYAMYQRYKKLLIFLVAVFLASTIASVVIAVMGNIHVSGEEAILSGNHICDEIINPHEARLNNEILIPTVVWEIIALFLSAFVVIQHFYELRQSPTGWTMRDCFMVLITSHLLYFAAFVATSCFTLGILSPRIMYSTSVGSTIYTDILQTALQMFVLGPRLILSVREYNTKLVDSSEEEIGMTTIAFQECGHVSTSSDM
ncbi:hypothetical protein DFH29DRAFT_879350 [Suillus ampliporus]|nr:hypothetical protein DFH29DRAFT_879350 [Suillus ampliporus]